MTRFVFKGVKIAASALAVLPLAAVVAHAQPVAVKVSDLNMTQPAQMQEFNQRVDAAAKQICSAETQPSDLARWTACTGAVKAEAMDKLNVAREQAQQSSKAVNVASR